MSPRDALFARNFRKLKEDSGKRWKEIAADLEVDVRYVHNWADGTFEPRFGTLTRLARYFDVPLSYFAEEHDEAPSV